ncbi:MAG: hypothetical protein ACKO7R_09100 [Pseudanabaena sp.]
MGNRRSGLLVMRGDRCLIWEIGDQFLWLVLGRSLLDLRNRRSDFVVGVGAIAVLQT